MILTKALGDQRKLQLQFLVAELYCGWIPVTKQILKVTQNHQKFKKKTIPKAKMFAYIVNTGRNVVSSMFVACAPVFFAHATRKSSPEKCFATPFRVPKIPLLRAAGVREFTRPRLSWRAWDESFQLRSRMAHTSEAAPAEA